MVQLGDWDLIQRFGSALNLNVHFHMLFLDGVYAEDAYGQQGFHRVKAPTHQELNALVNTLSHRVARCPEKRGLLERDAENTWLTLAESEDDVLTQLHGSSVTYRIATGPQQGRKVFNLQIIEQAEGYLLNWLKILDQLICINGLKANLSSTASYRHVKKCRVNVTKIIF